MRLHQRLAPPPRGQDSCRLLRELEARGSSNTSSGGPPGGFVCLPSARWTRWRQRPRRRATALSAVVAVAAAALCLGGGVRPASATTENTACSFESTLDEHGGGSHEVSVTVSHTFDGIPAADGSCPQGKPGRESAEMRQPAPASLEICLRRCVGLRGWLLP